MTQNLSGEIKFQIFHVSYIFKTHHPYFSSIYITKGTITIYKGNRRNEKHLPILDPFSTDQIFLLSPFSSWLSLEQLPREGPLLPHSMPETFLFTYANPLQSSSSPFRGIELPLLSNFSFWPTSSSSCSPDLGSAIREPTERDLEGVKSGYLS